MQQKLPNHHLTRLDAQTGRRFLAKSLHPAVSLSPSESILPTPTQQGRLLMFGTSAAPPPLYATVLTPRDAGFAEQESFLGTLLKTHGSLVCVQAVTPMRAVKAAFQVAQQQRLTLAARFDPKAFDDYAFALDLIEKNQHVLCYYSLALMVFAENPAALQDKVTRLQQQATSQGITLKQESGAALAGWRTALPDQDSWPRPYKLFDQHVAPQLAGAIAAGR